MFKGKLQVWCLVILGSLALNGLFYIVPLMFHDLFPKTEEVSIQISETVDPILSEFINHCKFKNSQVTVSFENSDIVITNEDEKEGYTKYSNFLYSPLVLYARSSFTENDSGFISLDSSSKSPYMVDLYDILLGMENHKTWKDLGFSPKVIKGDVCLWIPNERSPYYPYIEELFYMTLNNGKILTDENRAVLKPRVDSLLNQCEKVSDISQEIMNEYKSPSSDYKIFIGPEFLYKRGINNSMSRNHNDAFSLVYFYNSPIISLNVFAKNDYPEGQTNVADNFIFIIQNYNSFMYQTGWRVYNSTFDLDTVGYAYKDNVF